MFDLLGDSTISALEQSTVGSKMLTNFFGPKISAQYVGTLRSSRRCKNYSNWKLKVVLESQKRKLYNYDKYVHVNMEKK